MKSVESYITITECHVNCSFLPQFFFFINLSVTCWLAVGNLSVNCRPTGFLGSSSSQLPQRLLGNYFTIIAHHLLTVLLRVCVVQSGCQMVFPHVLEDRLSMSTIEILKQLSQENKDPQESCPGFLPMLARFPQQSLTTF